MKVKILTNIDAVALSKQIEDFVSELPKQDYELEEIQFSTTNLVCTMIYSVMILYYSYYPEY